MKHHFPQEEFKMLPLSEFVVTEKAIATMPDSEQAFTATEPKHKTFRVWRFDANGAIKPFDYVISGSLSRGIP